MSFTYKELKPCYLLGVRCSVHGGLSYKRSDEDVTTEGEQEEATWTTERVIANKTEYRKAQALRNQIKRSMANLGVPGDLGIICASESLAEIEQAYRKWAVKVDKFNLSAEFSRMKFRVARFKIEGENELALKDMLDDLRDTMDALQKAVASADYKGIRSVVTQLRGYDMMLPEAEADYLKRAVVNARAQARDIRKSLEKRGEDLKVVQDRMNTSSVEFARFALMEPGSTLEDIDNDLLKRLAAAQAEERGSGIVIDINDAERSAVDTEVPSYLSAVENGDGPFALID